MSDILFTIIPYHITIKKTKKTLPCIVPCHRRNSPWGNHYFQSLGGWFSRKSGSLIIRSIIKPTILYSTEGVRKRGHSRATSISSFPIHHSKQYAYIYTTTSRNDNKTKAKTETFQSRTLPRAQVIPTITNTYKTQYKFQDFSPRLQPTPSHIR